MKTAKDTHGSATLNERPQKVLKLIGSTLGITVFATSIAGDTIGLSALTMVSDELRKFCFRLMVEVLHSESSRVVSMVSSGACFEVIVVKVSLGISSSSSSTDITIDLCGSKVLEFSMNDCSAGICLGRGV